MLVGIGVGLRRVRHERAVVVLVLDRVGVGIHPIADWFKDRTRVLAIVDASTCMLATAAVPEHEVAVRDALAIHVVTQPDHAAEGVGKGDGDAQILELAARLVGQHPGVGEREGIGRKQEI